MGNMNYTHCDNCGRHNANGHDICSGCITEELNRVEINEDAWIDQALMGYYEAQTELYEPVFEYEYEDLDIF